MLEKIESFEEKMITEIEICLELTKTFTCEAISKVLENKVKEIRTNVVPSIKEIMEGTEKLIFEGLVDKVKLGSPKLKIEKI